MILLVVMSLLPSLLLASNPGDETVDTVISSPIPNLDPADLAVRFRGLDPTTFSYAPRPVYEVGDIEQFIITSSEDTPARAAEMVLVAKADGVYFWVEQGLNYTPSEMQPLADIMSSQIMPRVRSTFTEEKKIPSDSNIYVLNVTDAGPGIAGLYNDADRFPNEIIPSSNEINSFLMAVDPSSPEFYLSVLAHEFQHMVQVAGDDSDDTWFVEGFAELGSLIAVPEYFARSSDQDSYVANYTGNQLNDWADEGESSAPYYAGASLFLAYVTQRFGEGWIRYVTAEPTDGIIGIDRALGSFGAVDPLTGEPATFDDLFADFVVANLVNDPTASDGRFGYSLVGITTRATPMLTISDYPTNLAGQSVNQFGTQYIELFSPPQTLSLNFQGQATARLLPTHPHSGDYFFWSQWGNQGDSRLTGYFDLRGVPSATLNFWTWYDIEELWDYGYISVSIDDGATWQVIELPGMTAENPYDRAFATGFTGISGSGVERPAPYIGFSTSDGRTVEEVMPGTAGEVAGLQTGDILVAADGIPINTTNFFDIIDQYAPGDTLTLTVNRGGQTVDLVIPELGTHPDRMVSPTAEWVQHSVDLTPFVGNKVLVRFDYVTDQATSLPGWVIDDVTIPEIGFSDDMEQANPVWQTEGWVRINNLVPQEYFVQLIQFGNGVNVTRLLEPGGGSSGTWQVNLDPNQRTVLAISGAAPMTLQPAPFDLLVSIP
jgi:hypothetical protein